MEEFTVQGLRVIREAARHGSFSTTAERLGYTQSAVSRQISLMERAAGRALFERHARGVRPTEAGLLVVRHAEAILGELDATRQQLQDLDRQSTGRLRVGAFSTAMAALVPTAIGREPNVRVQLREGLSPGLIAAVKRGRLDLAVVTSPRQAPDGVELLPLLDDPLLVAVPHGHPLAGHTSVTPAQLRDERWIAGSTDPASTLLGAWHDDTWEPDVAYVARDWVAKFGLVAAGQGITAVPGLAAPITPPTLALVRIDHPAATRTTVLAQRPDAADLCRRFAEQLRDVVAELSADLRHRLRSAVI